MYLVSFYISLNANEVEYFLMLIAYISFINVFATVFIYMVVNAFYVLQQSSL